MKLVRVYFTRATTVGYPLREADGTVALDANNKPRWFHQRFHIGEEADIPEDEANNLIEKGLALLYSEKGLNGPPQAPPGVPPIAKEPAFGLAPVDDSGGDEETPADAADALARPPSQGLARYVR